MGEELNSPRHLARLSVPLSCCFQVGVWVFLLLGEGPLTATLVSAFAFGFSGSGHVCDEQGMQYI